MAGVAALMMPPPALLLTTGPPKNFLVSRRLAQPSITIRRLPKWEVSLYTLHARVSLDMVFAIFLRWLEI